MMDVSISDEEYVLQRAKLALKTDPLSAKAWMITAKTLYPNNFGVQFEAYCIEKIAGHVKEAAKCFSELIGKFQQQPEFWAEIEKVTTALRSESECNDPEKQFLCEMFKHISSEVQHKLLLLTAEHCEDTMEHCKLLLLLLQKFPSAIASHGQGLVDTLLTAEKHSHPGNEPINPYRKLLVCDLLPLLASDNISVELNPKMLYKLLHKTIEYYLSSASILNTPNQDSDSKRENPWSKLFFLLEFIGKQLKWDPYLLCFGTNWSKESYWQKLVTFAQTHNLTVEDQGVFKQLLYCSTIFLLHCLFDYNESLAPEAPPGQSTVTFTLVEAFLDPNLANPTEPKTKRRKTEIDITLPYISIEKPEQKIISNNFLITVHCWDMLHSTELLQREFLKICTILKLDISSHTNFLIDYAIYKGKYEEALIKVQQEPEMLISKYLRSASIFYMMKNFAKCFENILQVLPILSTSSNPGIASTSLTVGGSQRHLHFLPMSEMAILQYCTKLLIRSIMETMEKHQTYNEMAIGHLLILSQLDWPQEEDIIPSLLEQIKQRGSFHYYLFQSYVINVDILEELTYLWTNQGGQITLDIIPHLGQRRIGTRGADKGVKEEIKQAIRRQIARSNEPIHELIHQFITKERTYILQTIM